MKKYIISALLIVVAVALATGIYFFIKKPAAAVYKAGGVVTVQVTGYTDTSGSVPYNQRLSQRRAKHAADVLVRMGVPPFRIEIATTISGVEFESCHRSRVDASIDGVPVAVIDLASLRRNKQAAGRNKDLDDLEHLPTVASSGR